MSYILDALRKSESERRQGRVPDLGQQVQLVHKPRKKSSALAAWIGAGLVLNAVVLVLVFWPPASEFLQLQQIQEPAQGQDAAEQAAPAEQAPAARQEPRAETEMSAGAEVPAQSVQPEPVTQQRPTIIVPSRSSQPRSSQQSARQSAYASAPEREQSSVPHLVELPLAFQKSVPDLTFNSHIYASEPSSRRVMINNRYLRAGDVFAGIRVEQITEEGVILSRNGRSFRMGIVTDWVSPR